MFMALSVVVVCDGNEMVLHRQQIRITELVLFDSGTCCGVCLLLCSRRALTESEVCDICFATLTSGCL